MSDWKQAPAILANLFGVVNLGGDTLRVVFGEKFNESDEGRFHWAVQMNHEGALRLIELLQQALGGTQSGGSAGSGPKSGGGPNVVLGSTSWH
jgi:hypothetical protein